MVRSTIGGQGVVHVAAVESVIKVSRKCNRKSNVCNRGVERRAHERKEEKCVTIEQQ